jgi:hypothetical protein
MVNYNCELCNYKTKLRGDYNKHLKTKKHQRNILEENGCSENTEDKKVINKSEMNRNEPKMNQNEPQMNQNEPQMNQLTDKNHKNYKCKLCSIEFFTKASLRRHELHRCKEAKTDDTLYIKEKEWGKEKKILYKQINALIKKAGNTTTHLNQNNINLNSYGKEDLSHITNSFKTNLIKGPFGMIPKMIEAVHFNDEKPENKNICYPNKKKNTIKIFKEGKWKYYNKEELMEEIMENNYYILDVHYDEKKDNVLNDVQKKRYRKFKDKYDNGELDKGTKDEINLILLNGEKL